MPSDWIQRTSARVNASINRVSSNSRLVLLPDILCTSSLHRSAPHEVGPAASVVAHPMTAATPLTRDTTLRQLQHHSMWASGYRAKRHKPKKGEKTQQPALSPASTYMPFAGRWWGCVIPPLKSRLSIPPMLPLKGYHYALPRRESYIAQGFFA